MIRQSLPGRLTTFWLAALAAISALVISGCASTTPPDDGPLPARPVIVSDKSPFTGCEDVGEDYRFKNSEVQPYLAVNPAALTQGRVGLVGIWAADRYEGRASAGLVAAASSDGGRTWTRTPLALNGCTTGALVPDFARATDPWVSFGPDGTAYLSALVVEPVTRQFVVATAFSADGGQSWQGYREVARARAADHLLLERPSITADPTRPGTVYLTWTQHDTATGSLRRSVIFLAKSTDGGQTWGEPMVAFDPLPGHIGVGNQMVVDPKSGNLYSFFSWALQVRQEINYEIGFMRSTDGGETWSAPQGVAKWREYKLSHPGEASDEPLATNGMLPQAAIDPASGRLYVVWEDARFTSGKGGIALAWSQDQGNTWSEPVQVNTPDALSAFRPAVAVNSKGQVAVSYYDFRELKGNKGRMPTHFWLALLAPTETGLTPLREEHIAGPFDLNRAPKTPSPIELSQASKLPGPFLGDYSGLVGIGEQFGVLYITADDRWNPTDVNFVGVTP